jgi:cytochrome P450
VSGCPVAHELAPFDVEYLEDPYRVFAELRRRAPVHYSPELDMWVITRYVDIEAIFRDHDRFSAAVAQAPVSPLAPAAQEVLAEPGGPLPVMSNCDPPRHTRIRQLNMQTFSARRIGVLEPRIRERVASLVGALPADGPVDLVTSLTFPLPALTIFTLLGFPDEDAAQLKAWSDDRLYLVWGRLPSERQEAVARNFRAFYAYCQKHIERRLAEPADDFTSDLLEHHRRDPEAITTEEVASVVFGLSFAGHETTTNLLSNCLRNLIARRDAWQRLCDDPSLIQGAVEEVLRLDSSVICWRRIAKQPVEIAGTQIPEGGRLLLLLGSANRDPEVFEAPDELRLDRHNARRHLSFGKGIHFCLGAQLARLQAQIVLEHLTRERPGIEILPDQPLEFPANISFRGPLRLLAKVPAGTGSIGVPSAKAYQFGEQ